MKANLRIFSTLPTTGIMGGFVFLPFNAAQAIEPPPDDARPPAAILENNGTSHQSSPFLGVVTEALPDMLAEHLEIESGTGVIIRTVCPDSPADKAGLSVNDIILNIADKPVRDPDEVTKFLRKHKAGERISLDLIHKGKPSRVEVTLIERPADEIAANDDTPLLNDIPEEHAARLRDLIEQNLKALDPQLQGDAFFPDARFDGTFRMLRDRMNKNLLDIPQFEIPEGGFQQKSTIRLMDNNGSIELLSDNNNTEATVRDTENNILWSGPWNTEEDKAAAPQEIRDRIERVQSGNSFSFRLENLNPSGD
jgi:serine protease Do